MGRQFGICCLPNEFNGLFQVIKPCGDHIFVHGCPGKPEIFTNRDAPLEQIEEAITRKFFLFWLKDWEMMSNAISKIAKETLTYGVAIRTPCIECSPPAFFEGDKYVRPGRLYFQSRWNGPDRTPFVECVFRRFKKQLVRTETGDYATPAFLEWVAREGWTYFH